MRSFLSVTRPFWLPLGVATVASAYTCYTSCYWLGNQQYCNTTCG